MIKETTKPTSHQMKSLASTVLLSLLLRSVTAFHCNFPSHLSVQLRLLNNGHDNHTKDAQIHLPRWKRHTPTYMYKENDSKLELHEHRDLPSTISRRDFVKNSIVTSVAVATILTAPSALADDETSISKDESNEREKSNRAFDPRYFIAGGGCAAFSHGLATPFDVVKTKMQAEPETFDEGFLDAITSLVKINGPGVLLSGFLPTLVGFGVEGAVKFGVYESLKPAFMSILNTNDKFIPYLAASVGAGMVASLMLCPMERTRISMVTSEEKTDLFESINKLIQEEGLQSLFFGYSTMLIKQIPYTVTKQVSFEFFATQLALMSNLALAPNEETRFLTTVISAFSASVLACIISQPGDVLLTKTFKENTNDYPFENARKIFNARGLNGFYTGFSARLVHVACIVTSQLVVYDSLKQLLGLPATGS